MLRPGDTVMLVSPSGPTRPERVARGVELLTGWGLRPVPAPHAYARQGYLAGTDELRAADLNAAFADPQVRGVICTRGGYGAQRVVDAIDMAAVRRDPKVVAGFSDITALQFALWRGARLASVHGPGAAWRDERTPLRSAESLHAALMTTEPVTVTARGRGGDLRPYACPGRADGPLLGGNLCLIAASVGTPDMPDLTGAVLLIEDVQEPPYKVDRMLTQLRRAGALDRRGRGGGRPVHRLRRRLGHRPSSTCSPSASATSAYRCSAACRSATASASSPSRSAPRPPSTPTPAPSPFQPPSPDPSPPGRAVATGLSGPPARIASRRTASARLSPSCAGHRR